MTDPGTRPSARIAFVIAHLGPGGAQRVLSEVANALAADDHDVHVVTILEEPADIYPLHPSITRYRLARRLGRERDGGDGREHMPTPIRLAREVRRATRNVAFFSGTVVTLRATLRSIAPDTVLSLITVTNLMTILATRGLCVRTLVSERNDLQLDRHHRGLETLRRWVYPWSDVVTANTHGALSDLERFVPKPKLAYLPNPVRVPVSHERVEYTGPTFVCVARLVHQKGIDTLLEASARAFDVLPTWRLAILGAGPLRQELESMARELGIAGRVDWFGQVDDPFPYLRAAQFFVSTSRFEGSPNALLEAMSCGLPAVVTDASPGPLELVGDEEAGLVVSVDDVDATTAAIRRLATDVALRQSLGRAAVVRVQVHRPERVLRMWRELIASGSPDGTYC